MTRSLVYPGSLFRDSDSDRTDPSTSDDRSRGSRGSKKKKTRRDDGGGGRARPVGAARAESPSPSCGTRFDFLSHILDVFSLNGLGCCRHVDDDGGGGGGGAQSGMLGGGICA